MNDGAKLTVSASSTDLQQHFALAGPQCACKSIEKREEETRGVNVNGASNIQKEGVSSTRRRSSLSDLTRIYQRSTDTGAFLLPNAIEESQQQAKISNDIEVVIKIGNVVPDFTLKSMNDEEYNLSDFRGSKVMLCFYKFKDCPGCAYRVASLIGSNRKLAWASKLKVNVKIFDPCTGLFNISNHKYIIRFIKGHHSISY